MSTQPVSPYLPQAAASASSSSSGASSGASTGSDMDVTFLNLLITELKSQDPTAPMDATQMVGQMISLNQLDQLIGIHQLLQIAVGSSSAKNATTTVAGGK